MHRPDGSVVQEATETQIEAMQRKLAARMKEITGETIAKPLQAVQSPKAKSKLEWERPVTGATGVKTKCKRYACAKVFVDGKPHYELSKLTSSGEWYVRIDKGAGLDNFMQAQVLAQQDADKLT